MIATVAAELVARSALHNLENVGIVRETTGRQRGRVSVYDAYLSILQRGTEL